MAHIKTAFRLESKIRDMGTGALADTREEGIFKIGSRCLPLAAVIPNLVRNCWSPSLVL